MSYSTIPDIAKQASKDLGFTMDGVVDLVAPPEPHGQRSAVDRYRRHVESGGPRSPCRRASSSRRCEIAKITDWSQLTPLYTEGVFAGKGAPPGRRADRVVYRDSINTTTFRRWQDFDFATLVPSVYNADTLGIVPTSVGRDVHHLAVHFKGKAAIATFSDRWHHGRHDGVRGDG